MELESIKEALMYLCTKYVPRRQDLIELLNSWEHLKGFPVKFFLSEIDKYKIMEYDLEDLQRIKLVASFFV